MTVEISVRITLALINNVVNDNSDCKSIVYYTFIKIRVLELVDRINLSFIDVKS